MACGKFQESGHHNHTCPRCHFYKTEIDEIPCRLCGTRRDGGKRECYFLDAEKGE